MNQTELKPFLLKLFAPRPTFHLDITPEEMSVMQVHAVYWRELLERGVALAFGPVLQPEESWGVALLYAQSLDAAQAIAAEDPASKAGMHIEVYPMGSLVHK